MINLNIKKIIAKNCFCFGPEGIEIDVEKFSPIIHVTGENLDVLKNDHKRSRNGIGKSSICDVIVYCLFGKTVKDPQKIKIDDIIHRKIKKKAYLEVIIDKYRIVRTRKPNTLRIWESEEEIWNDTTEITLGKGTQKLIQDKLGVSFETFCNLIIFSDNNKNSFLECDLAGKRQIIDNLLSLDEFKELHDNAKNLKSECSNKVKILTHEYEQLITEINFCKNRIAEIKDQETRWKSNKKQEINDLIARIKAKQEELKQSDIGQELEKYNKAQDEIGQLKPKITELQVESDKITGILKPAQEKLDKLRLEKNTVDSEIFKLNTQVLQLKSEITKNERYIRDLTAKDGTQCNSCFGIISKDNLQHIIDKTTKTLQEYSRELGEAEPKLLSLQERQIKYDSGIKQGEKTVNVAVVKRNKLNEQIDAFRAMVTQLSTIDKPELTTREMVIQESINNFKNDIMHKKGELEGESPYVSLLRSAEDELMDKLKKQNDKKKDVVEAEKMLPYYTFWEKGFNSEGIPMMAINGMLPALNSQSDYWMQFLIEGKIRVHFDGSLDSHVETYPNNGDPFVYATMSGGEKRRMNLAIAAALSNVHMLSAGIQLNMMFLDEVSSNIDAQGVDGVYRMICELSKERKTFVTTHSSELHEMLSGHDLIYLQKKDGFSKIVN